MVAASLEEALQQGLRHHCAGRLQCAEGLYREVLAVDPSQPDALHLLGMAAHAQGRSQDALDLLRQAVGFKPHEAVFHANLGVILESLGRPAEAEVAYRRALELNPREQSALNNLGNLHRAAWRLDDAADCYRAAIARDPQFALAHGNLGAVFADQRRFDEAIACYRRALALDDSLFDARQNLAIALTEQGREKVAAAELTRGRTLWPDNSGLKIRSALLLPVITSSVAAIDECRSGLAQALEQLRSEDLHVRNPILETPGPAFYLAYHGRNDVQLQKQIAAMYEGAVPSVAFRAPHCRRTHNHRSGPIRVGLISRFFHGHSIGDHYGGLLRAFPREGVRYTVLRFPGPRDGIARLIETGADEVVLLPPELAEAREKIAACELDVLLYTDIGMDPWTYFLAFSRLAPVQCVTLGHPVTTGIHAIDYFLSCKWLETPDADGHYSERLVRLDNIPHYFDRPQAGPATKTRADFQLPSDARWYVCQQTLFKIHPEFDVLIGQILRRDSRGVVILFEDQAPNWKQLLLERFQRTISDVAGRIHFLPRLAYGEYLDFLTLADVLLDTIHFGAGTTTYHALAFGVPLVTWPGEFARSRGTYAAYARIGLPELACTSAREYVDRAVAIAGDPSMRAAIGEECRKRGGSLFGNTAGARELEEFFRESVRRRSISTAEAGR